MKLSITENEARYLHQNFYDGPFEIIRITRSGPMDFFPFSLMHGASDYGSWNGLMSTDGRKFVVTKSAYLNIAEIKNKFEFQRGEIESIKNGVFKLKFVLDKKIEGLTKGSIMRTLLIFPGVVLYLIPAIIAWKMPQKIIEVRVNDELKTLTKFNKLVGI